MSSSYLFTFPEFDSLGIPYFFKMVFGIIYRVWCNSSAGYPSGFRCAFAKSKKWFVEATARPMRIFVNYWRTPMKVNWKSWWTAKVHAKEASLPIGKVSSWAIGRLRCTHQILNTIHLRGRSIMIIRDTNQTSYCELLYFYSPLLNAPSLPKPAHNQELRSLWKRSH